MRTRILCAFIAIVALAACGDDAPANGGPLVEAPIDAADDQAPLADSGPSDAPQDAPIDTADANPGDALPDVEPDTEIPDGTTDDAPDDSQLDSPIDAPLDSPPDSPVDSPLDAPVDSPPDGPADGGPEAGPAMTPSFLTLTSGGAKVSSPSYRLELFIAPGTVGSTESSAHRVWFGPGALRR